MSLVFLGEVEQRSGRWRELLDAGIDAHNIGEYQVLTLQLAEAVPQLVRALTDVMRLRDELLRDTSTVSVVAHSFAQEIDRALKGQR